MGLLLPWALQGVRAVLVVGGCVVLHMRRPRPRRLQQRQAVAWGVAWGTAYGVGSGGRGRGLNMLFCECVTASPRGSTSSTSDRAASACVLGVCFILEEAAMPLAGV